ncbi:ComEC/Rec2 family competence protein [Candidatus Tisiphia endosymbiont of Beris chalybata]|uniref:ComEC/Rec2 family competence protein n=1 Tax=Candidatus Tisiphia endosymbiont of Beris chalybata TaxID=3066262 RepID=UPI00312C9EA8
MVISKYRTYTNNYNLLYILDFLHKSKIVEEFLEETKPSRAAYIDASEERRRVSTTKLPTRLTDSGTLIHKALASPLEHRYNPHIFQTDECVISPVEGIVNAINSRNRGLQITLTGARIYKLQQKLAKVRITVPAKYAKEIDINSTIKIVAKLCRPQNSLLPGGYDFSFYAYFNNLGATGFALAPPKIISYTNLSTNNLIYHLRKNIYNRLIQVLGSCKGNFAAAILLGETKALDKNIMQAMRQGGVSHILCVSGLHLSLVATILFMATRFLLNLSNYIAYNYNIKSVAAICSLIGSYSYLELTNMQIAATRAFIMTAIFIYALMVERSVFPLRSLAAAAFIILSLNPEVVFHPSFQLSFIAVLSLTSGYEFYLKNQWVLGENKGIFAKVKFYYASNIYSSLLAGVVTAPVVINQFYTFPTYSIILNLIAVPIMSFFLMPLAIMSLWLMIFGIDHYCLKLMGFFIDLIIKSVKFTTLLPFPLWHVGYISKLSLITFLLGFFWICLWQTKWRFLGLIIIFLSFILMILSPLPNFILDIKTNNIGLKNNNSELEIHNYFNEINNPNALRPPINTRITISNFKRLYWAQWFGQKDAKIFMEPQNKFISQGNKLIINSQQISNKEQCENADIYLNLASGSKCRGHKMTITKEYLQNAGVIMIFCNTTQCKIVTNNNRFSG